MRFALATLASAVALVTAGTGVAGAATIEPCSAVVPPTYRLDGDSGLTLTKGFARKLRKQKVRIAPIAPAKRAGAFAFTLEGLATEGRSATADLGGGIRLRAKRRKPVKLLNLDVAVRDGGGSVVSGHLGGRRMDVFTLAGGGQSVGGDGFSASVSGAPLKLTRPAAKVLRKRLGIKKAKRLRAGATFGMLHLSANRTVVDPGSGGTPPPETSPPPEPPVMPRPAGAVDVVSATLDWRIRDSFVRYVNAGEGTYALEGAVADPPEAVGSVPPLVYSYSFPFKSGWFHDAPEGEPDTANLLFSGGVGFRYCDHTINFATLDPEMEVNGASSRLVFKVLGLDGTTFPGTRGVLVGFDLSSVEPTVSGGTVTYEDVPGFIPPGTGDSVFAGFYFGGAEFGSADISFTTG